MRTLCWRREFGFISRVVFVMYSVSIKIVSVRCGGDN